MSSRGTARAADRLPAGPARRRRALLPVVLVLGVLTGLTGCSPAPTTDETREGDQPAAVRAGQVLRQQSRPRAWGLAAADSGNGHVSPLPVRPGWGPTRREIRRARTLVSKLSLPELAGQMIMARYDGTSAPTEFVDRLHLGGVIVFSDNVTGNDQIRTANRRVQQAARADGRRFPVAIAVDQEGGLVERVTTGTRFPTFMTAGAADDPGLTYRASAGSGAELAGLGFTMDFAPEADVTAGPADPVIGARSAGSDPDLVSRHSLAAARGYRSTGTVPVLKHFPGHGSVTADSHLTLPVQRKSRRALSTSDLVPFRDGVQAGLPAVMVGHIDVRAVDPGVPSSLSRKVVTGMLRKRLGFDGLVVTDALNMKAVSAKYTSGQAAVRALRAGADLLLMPPSPREARAAIVRAVKDGRLDHRRLVQAGTRQVALLLHRRSAGVKPAPPGSSAGVSARWSAAAITSVSGPCSGRLVSRRVKVTGPDTAVARFKAAAAAAGLLLGKKGTTVRLIGYGGGPARGDVVVALDRPYPLGGSRATVARIATYGSTPGAMRALVAVLLGEAGAPGRLPVPVSGVPRTGC